MRSFWRCIVGSLVYWFGVRLATFMKGACKLFLQGSRQLDFLFTYLRKKCNSFIFEQKKEAMMAPFFISYSSVDGKAFSLKLADELLSGPPAIPVWLDKRELQPGDDWDSQIDRALKTCKGLLFVMTGDSVDDLSVCKNEWVQALRYKKPVIPLRFSQDTQLPFRLSSRQFIDFTDSFHTGVAQLRRHFSWMDSPAGQLQSLTYRMEEAQRDLRRATPSEEARIQEEIVELKQQIQQQQELVANPQAAEKRVEESIKQGLERERQPEKSVSGQSRSKFVNPPPLLAPAWFQNRHDETRFIGDFLKDEALRLMIVVGRGGIGKSAMVCRLLRSLEGGQIPDGGGQLSVDGIVYLSDSRAFNRVNVPDLYAGLQELMPEDTKKSLDLLYKKTQKSTGQLMQTLVKAFPKEKRVVVLLDNFEDELDTETGTIRDPELYEALHSLLQLPPHGLKLIITTRIAPQALMLFQPNLQQRLNLDEGLKAGDAEKMLRDMDKQGTVGLKNAPTALLLQAQERTRGFPRALEYLFGILAADRDATLEEIIENTARALPEKVVDVLVGEAFSRLDLMAQRVIQALAIYRFPVTPAAVDYLLQPFVAGVNSSPVLGRLVNMQFVRRDQGRYYLHQIDHDYALSRIPKGNPIDRNAKPLPFNRFALQHRGAEWFSLARKPKENCMSLDDLSAQLSEFDLRFAGEEYDTAGYVLRSIDSKHLNVWGHYRLMANLHERLHGKITDPYLRMSNLGILGVAYFHIGDYKQADIYTEQALRLAQEQHDRSSEVIYLINLGSICSNLEQTKKAIGYFDQALEIAQDAGDRYGEAISLGNFGNEYYRLGQTIKAIGYYASAHSIFCEMNNRDDEATTLLNFGLCYADLGQSTKALQYFENAFDIAKQIGSRHIESSTIGSFGCLSRKQGKWEEAIQQFKQAMKIADEIGSINLQCSTRIDLAETYIYKGEFSLVYRIVEEAQKHNIPLWNQVSSLVLGVAALLQGDYYAAQKEFVTAIHYADELLAVNPQKFTALEKKGLALCGLALCENKREYTSAAKEAYSAARIINSDPGIVADVLQLFDTLTKADKNGILATVRPYAAAERVE